MQLYKDAMVFIDEAGPLKEGQSYSMFVSCIVTNDDKLNWVKGLNHHFIDDRPERRKEFLNILVNNKQKFKVVLLKYNISLGEGSKMSDYYFEIYVKYPIKELSEIVERRVEIFYDSLNDKLSREKRHEVNCPTLTDGASWFIDHARSPLTHSGGSVEWNPSLTPRVGGLRRH
ncbi:hypothetical protein [Metallosphaera javensis (ex Hofmann et al. 2022)]|uniref:hypothetical protein n=1 Tax=Metallosphaera javensis (ex Hofmann et al. 2022) TaxID=99938 RepID=UPI001EDCC715|nr:hypothetical protein [Metallosphaera javensis (ex Hofmann et al. 2022)]